MDLHASAKAGTNMSAEVASRGFLLLMVCSNITTRNCGAYGAVYTLTTCETLAHTKPCMRRAKGAMWDLVESKLFVNT